MVNHLLPEPKVVCGYVGGWVGKETFMHRSMLVVLTLTPIWIRVCAGVSNHRVVTPHRWFILVCQMNFESVSFDFGDRHCHNIKYTHTWLTWCVINVKWKLQIFNGWLGDWLFGKWHVNMWMHTIHNCQCQYQLWKCRKFIELHENGAKLIGFITLPLSLPFSLTPPLSAHHIFACPRALSYSRKLYAN